MISPFAPGQQPSTQQAITPQQRMAMALMQPQAIDQGGDFSPMQGISSLLNGYMAGQMMKQGQQPDMNSPASQALGLGASMGSVGPTNANAALFSGMPMQQQPNGLAALGSGLFGLDQ